MFASYGNKSIEVKCKSTHWFLIYWKRLVVNRSTHKVIKRFYSVEVFLDSIPHSVTVRGINDDFLQRCIWNFLRKSLRTKTGDDFHKKRSTAQKIKFSIEDFFSKCEQICRKLQIWPDLLKNSLMGNFFFCVQRSILDVWLGCWLRFLK